MQSLAECFSHARANRGRPRPDIVRPMVDERIRAAERVWRASNSSTDLATYLREQLRAGLLPLDRVTSAASWGAEAACSALGYPPPPACQLLRQLLTHETSDSARGWAYLWLGRKLLGQFEARHPGLNRPRQVFDSAEQWLRCPCDEHLQSFLGSSQTTVPLSAGENEACALIAAGSCAVNANPLDFEDSAGVFVSYARSCGWTDETFATLLADWAERRLLENLSP